MKNKFLVKLMDIKKNFIVLRSKNEISNNLGIKNGHLKVLEVKTNLYLSRFRLYLSTVGFLLKPKFLESQAQAFGLVQSQLFSSH